MYKYCQCSKAVHRPPWRCTIIAHTITSKFNSGKQSKWQDFELTMQESGKFPIVGPLFSNIHVIEHFLDHAFYIDFTPQKWRTMWMFSPMCFSQTCSIEPNNSSKLCAISYRRTDTKHGNKICLWYRFIRKYISLVWK